MPSQDELVKECRRDDALRSLAVLCSNQVLDGIGAEPIGVDHSEHAAVLHFLAMLMVDEESDGLGTDPISKVAQIHERALSEEGEVEVAQPHEKAAALRLKNLSILVECLDATEASKNVKQIFSSSFMLTALDQ